MKSSSRHKCTMLRIGKKRSFKRSDAQSPASDTFLCNHREFYYFHYSVCFHSTKSASNFSKASCSFISDKLDVWSDMTLKLVNFH